MRTLNFFIFLIFVVQISRVAEGRDLIIEASAPARVRKTIESLRRGLSPEDRAYVTILLSRDLKMATVKIAADHQSTSPNFQVIKKLYVDAEYTIIISMATTKETFSSYFETTQGGQLKLVPFEEIQHYKNHVGKEVGVLGWTLLPHSAEPTADAMYSADEIMRIYITSELQSSRTSETLYHELKHAYLFEGGRTPIKGLHDQPGVNEQILAAQLEARSHFYEK